MYRKRHLTAALAALMTTAACGLVGGDTGGAAASVSAQCTDEKVTYQLSFIANPQHAGFLVAYDKGFFEDEGVDMEMKEGGPVVNPTLQVAQGNVDLAEITLADALNATANNAEISLVAQQAQQNPLRYISWKDVPLSGPEDLRGRSVGIQRAGNVTPEMAVMLGEAGLSRDDVQIKQIAFDVSDFMDRKVDVFPLRTYAHIPMLEEQGVSYPEDVNVLDPNEYGAGLPDAGIYANNEFLRAHGNAVACTLRAQRAGWEAAAENPDEAKRIVAEYAPAGVWSTSAIDTDVDEVLNYMSVTPEGETVEPLSIDMDYLTDGARKLQDVGQVPEDIDVRSIIDTEPLRAAGSPAR
ncbi:ABC transporter substrate-binding protein [Streptomyces sp. 6N223]|uniref:ABC transporter substrate-binding protein n=1 Tax=Streptomyces sp. 6N223 TaxID=3457412 RepID=UPI003FCFB378